MGGKHPLLAQEKIWNDTEAGSKFKPHPFHWCFLLFSLVNCRGFLLQGLSFFFPTLFSYHSYYRLSSSQPSSCITYAIRRTECRQWRDVKRGIAVLCPAACSGSSSRSLGLYKGQRKYITWLPESCKAMQAGHQSHCSQARCRYCFNGHYLLVLHCCLCMLRDLC